MLTLTQVWGAFLIFTLCPVLGALPLTGWLTHWCAHDRASVLPRPQTLGILGARVYGGTIAGYGAIALEGAKGFSAVLLARYYFPADATWEIVALMALVMGRYWSGKAVGTTSLLAGSFLHDPIAAGLTALLSGLGILLVREQRQGRLLVVGVFALMVILRHPDGIPALLTAALAGLVGWIYHRYPDDLAVLEGDVRIESERLFGLFRSDRALLSLDVPQSPSKVGHKIALLSQLMADGYPIPKGYALLPGDDPLPLLEITQPSVTQPVIVRASVVGDSPAQASAAGQYPALANLTSPDALFAAIAQGFRSYDRASAVQYRRDFNLPETHLALLVQQQISCLAGGVAFSRNPFSLAGDAVWIEATLGNPHPILAGRQTPDRYQVLCAASDLPTDLHGADSWRISEALRLAVHPMGSVSGDVPDRLLEQVAFLTRRIELRYQGIPQAVEWGFDGDRLWVFQVRPLSPPRAPQPVPHLLAGEETTGAIAAHAPLTLSGLPVSPGKAEGACQRWQPDTVHPPVPSSVLIVPTLSASDLPRYASAVVAVIATTGGQLCQGAMVAREYGIPTVILDPAEAQRLAVGDRVAVNGDAGSVQVLSR